MGERSRIAETPDDDPREGRCGCCDERAGLSDSDAGEASTETLTVKIEGDVDEALTELHYVRERAEEATDAIHRLQRAIDGLGDETGHTSTPWTERLTGDADSPERNADSDSDYGTPTPSSADVQERMESNDA